MASKKNTSKASAGKVEVELLDVVDMKDNVIARVKRFAEKRGTLKGSVARATEKRYVDWRVTEVDATRHAWADGMTLAKYVEWLKYGNELMAQLDGMGLDVLRLDVDMLLSAWRAWGRGCTQAKLVKRLFELGYGKGGQTQKEARKEHDARTAEQRAADVARALKRSD